MFLKSPSGLEMHTEIDVVTKQCQPGGGRMSGDGGIENKTGHVLILAKSGQWVNRGSLHWFLYFYINLKFIIIKKIKVNFKI